MIDTTSYPSNFFLPSKPSNSIKNAIRTTSPPNCSTNLTIASIVPPVAIKSSMITTFSPGLMASL